MERLKEVARWLRSSFYSSLILAFGSGLVLGRILTRHDARVDEVGPLVIFLLGVVVNSGRVLPFIPKTHK